MAKPENGKKRTRSPRRTVDIDIASLGSILHDCIGCTAGDRCCCSAYEVCVTAAEMRKIDRVMPEVLKRCPSLASGDSDIFDRVEPGLYAIDTDEDGRCVFAYLVGRKIRCALHTVAMDQGIPLAEVKPKSCLLWPMTCSDNDKVLSLTDDALLFHCNAAKRTGTGPLSVHFTETIEIVYGKGRGRLVEQAAKKGARRLKLARVR